jgi:hypothetical protein
VFSRFYQKKKNILKKLIINQFKEEKHFSRTIFLRINKENFDFCREKSKAREANEGKSFLYVPKNAIIK